jgi:hypothetical protein
VHNRAPRAEPAKVWPEADTLDAAFRRRKPLIAEPYGTRYRWFRSKRRKRDPRPALNPEIVFESKHRGREAIARGQLPRRCRSLAHRDALHRRCRLHHRRLRRRFRLLWNLLHALRARTARAFAARGRAAGHVDAVAMHRGCYRCARSDHRDHPDRGQRNRHSARNPAMPTVLHGSHSTPPPPGIP